MNDKIKWMAENHVAANLLMFLFVVGGLVMAVALKQEVFPEIALDRITVAVVYPGASPEEVEEGIVLLIEESIASVEGITEIRATAAEGLGTVSAVIQTGEDSDRILQDIKSEVDRITSFPGEAEKPVISKALIKNEVISVVVHGEVSERTLREWAELIRDELLELDEITQAELVGVRPYEIAIEVSEAQLRRYNLTLEQLAGRVRQASQDIPGGAIKSAGGEVLLRTKERRYLGREYEEVTILAGADGGRVRLADFATVRDTFEDIDLISRFDGQPAAMIKVFRVGDQKPTVIAEAVKRFVAARQAAMPETVAVSLWNDNTELLRSRFNLLLKNAALGLVLVLVTLSLLLEIKLALWVMLGIPISFMGALFLMPLGDVSINMITLFAFIMALGIVVDDAVVVGENVYEHRREGKSLLQAAVDGTCEVGVPVVFSVLTTVAAFLPLLYVIGTMGKFIRVIPVVVISILAVSLIESLFILPAHLSLQRKQSKEQTGSESPPHPSWLERLRLAAGRRLEWLISGPYHQTLDFCLHYRYLTLAAALAILMLTAGVLGGGFIKFRFMPEVDGDIVLVDLEMPQGTLVADTARVEAHLVESLRRVIAEFDAQREDGSSIVRNVYSVIGATVPGGGPGGGAAATGTHRANTILFMQPSEVRNLSASRVASRWREEAGEIPGVHSLTFTTNLIRFGANIDVKLAHDDFAVLTRAVARLKDTLAEYPGVGDIADNYPAGKRELKLRLTPEARTLGVSEEDLGRQVRAAFYGIEALRLQRGRNEVKVVARYPEAERKSPWNLEQMRIRTPNGGELPLVRAATVEEGRGFSEISRTDRKRVINVTASVDEQQANAEEILTELKGTVLTELVADFPGLSYDLEGEEKERRDSMGSMMRGFVLALFAIYALLAIPLRSYGQPLIIMSAIPFGIVGALIGHGVLGYNLSILSIFGIVALSGVVVNNSLLLIDRINRNQAQGMAILAAINEAGRRRFRPIILTSLTTFFGLFPMILETSVQAQFLIPMAISLGFGVLFSTFVTLLLVPTLCALVADLRP